MDLGEEAASPNRYEERHPLTTQSDMDFSCPLLDEDGELWQKGKSPFRKSHELMQFKSPKMKNYSINCERDEEDHYSMASPGSAILR